MRWPWPTGDVPTEEDPARRIEAERARKLVEESRELMLVLDAEDRVIAASRRAREGLDGIDQGSPVPAELLEGGGRHDPLRVSYEVDGHAETILYLWTTRGARGLRGAQGLLHRLGLARAPYPAGAGSLRCSRPRHFQGENPAPLIDQARTEVEQIRELIDDVLYLQRARDRPRRRRAGLDEGPAGRGACLRRASNGGPRRAC